MNESSAHFCKGGDITYAGCRFCQHQAKEQAQLESLGNKPPPEYVYEGGITEPEQ